MALGLKLRRLEVTQVNYLRLGVFRLRVEAFDPCGGMDKHVFLWNQRPPNPYDGSIDNEFLCVASPPDMSAKPAGEPEEDRGFPFFRRDFFEVDLPSSLIVEQVWGAVLAEVTVLIEALERMQELQETVVVELGDCDGSGSDSDTTP